MNLEVFLAEQNKYLQVSVFLVIFIACWNLEHFFGVTDKYNKWKHLRTNALFVLPGFILQTLLGFIFIKVLLYERQMGYGLFDTIGLTSATGQLIFTFVFLDFLYWLYHFLMHKIKVAWRFHSVHHSDKVLDVGTSLREHPMETIIRLSHYMIGVWFLGPIVWIISLHQFIQIISKIIIHSNFRFTDKVDKYVSYFFLTPNMHHVHHHHEQPYTDSNFGDLFSIWDRVFGTFQYLSKEEVVFGLDVDVYGDPDSKNLRFKGLMKIPFTKNKLSN
jgi:sterol desaturase/sphingolipid hydroxylase (fatty acid hydroxylase superfamily)